MENKSIRERAAALLSVKTLVTLSLTATFVYLSVTKFVDPKEFVGLYMVIIGFYFGTQKLKD